MKRLIIMRHASSPDGPIDHRRPLSDVGRAEALSTATQLAARGGWTPQRVWSSNATRTIQTCEGLMDVFPALLSACTFDRALYNTTAKGMLAPLDAMPPGLQVALLVGHNPSVSRAVSWLSGLNDHQMQPAEAALLQSVVAESWPNAAGSWQLVALLKPQP
jgi:phosphohistidine phosphatase